MFSSQQLISYVFANPDDEYRGNDLMTLNLKQYLWQSLHAQYNTVYFLHSPDGVTMSVRTFGDKYAKPYKPSFLGFNEQRRFGDWLLEQMDLPADKAAAFVCDLGDFCTVFSQSGWESMLKKLAADTKRTGIFVLTASPYSEDSLPYLLESPVFDLLHETAVTENRGLKRCIYSSIQEAKPLHYRCLNAFTPERISTLLLHICAADPRRCLDRREREEMAAALASNLYGSDPLPGILSPSQPALYLTYRDLYQLLQNRSNWEEIRQLTRLPAVKIPPILRSPDCYAGRCLKLPLPDWVMGKPDSSDRYPEDTLRGIQETVCLPPNSPENRQLMNTAQAFLENLRNLEDGDIDTCSLLLDALNCCIQWITVCEKDSNYQDILDSLKLFDIYAKSSSDLYLRERNLAARERDPSAPSIERLRLPGLRKQLDDDKLDHSDCVGYLRYNITIMQTTSSTSGVLKELLNKEMRKDASAQLWV